MKGAFCEDVASIQIPLTQEINNNQRSEIKKISIHTLVKRIRHCIDSNRSYFE